jgi:tetratricopeptide (TPR) repeat protein
VTETFARRERGALLHDQGRHELAEREYREHLAAQPDDGIGHALLSLTLVELERLPDADSESRTAIALAPDEPFAHYARARVMLARRHHDEAVAAASETIRLDPDHPRGFAILAAARLAQRRWSDAVAATDAGLALEPEHENLLTIRGLALRHLGRSAESQASFEGALRRDPENSYAHASRGLGLLHDGRMSEALDAYREALRLDPTNEMARSGLVEALKARNVLYAALLRGMLFLGRLSGRSTFLLFFGFFIIQRTLRELVRAEPSLAPIVFPLLGIYLFVVWLTYAADPLFNLLLRLDSFGRHALTDGQRLESSIVGPLVAIGLPAAIVTVLTGSEVAALIASLGLGLVVPVAATFGCEDGWPRTVMTGVTALILIVGAIGLAVALSGDEATAVGFGFITLFLIAVSSWIALPLTRVTVRR